MYKFLMSLENLLGVPMIHIIVAAGGRMAVNVLRNMVPQVKHPICHVN